MKIICIVIILALSVQSSHTFAGDPIDQNGFEIISIDSFEGMTINYTYVDTILEPDASVSTNGVTVTANGDSPATVKVSSAVNEHQAPGILIELEGGQITIDLPSIPEQVTETDGSLSTTLCPDPDYPNYPVKYCLKAPKTANLASITYLGDQLGQTRLPSPGNQIKEKLFFTLYRSIFIQENMIVSFLKSACQSLPNCNGDPVLLVHGFQPEPLGYKPGDNGGRNYWGYFPERLINDGYTPNEFIWHTNAQFEDVAQDLKNDIELIKSQTGKKVHLVAHSFGGVLVRRLLQDTDPKFLGIAASIASVTTIGTPHLGIFKNETADPATSFPDGQDSNLFKGCGQISCHMMGENIIGSSIASLLDVEVDFGSETRFLASTWPSLPALQIQSLIGFTHFLSLGGIRYVRPGDYLLTAQTQRFLTAFVFSNEEPQWQDFWSPIGVGQATLKEFALGRYSKDDPPLELFPNKPVSAEDFVQYKHSKSTPGAIGDVLASEPFVPNVGYHDGYQRVLDWIGGPQQPPNPIPLKRLTAGTWHNCAITPSSSVKCWGADSSGQLGDGTVGPNRTSLSEVIGLSGNVAVIGAGYVHTCAITVSGGAKCWGADATGQLGDGNSGGNRATPGDVVDSSSGVAAIAGGNYHTCAVSTVGGVKCWGTDSHGELGDGSSDAGRSIPGDVVGLDSGVIAVDAGQYHTCVLTTAGGVKCWGYDVYGNLGDGVFGPNRAVPGEVVGLSSGVAAIAVGGHHTCALTTNGGVKCWGYDLYGQLGDGTIGPNRATPEYVVGLTSGVESITAGESHTCALMTTGSVKCWGYDDSGQLGDGTIGPSRATPSDVAGLSSGVVEIVAGYSHTCALSSSGGIKCWGNDDFGELGDGTIGPDRASPADVIGFP